MVKYAMQMDSMHGLLQRKTLNYECKGLSHIFLLINQYRAKMTFLSTLKTQLKKLGTLLVIHYLRFFLAALVMQVQRSH